MTKSSDRYDSLIQWYAQLCYIPFELVKNQMYAESNMKPDAVSPCGAIGLLQIMPKTATDYGITNTSDLYNPEINIRIGCTHLKKQYDVFKSELGIERWKFAIASYNAGMGNIIKAQNEAKKRQLPQDEWDSIKQFLSLITGTHSSETIGYVEKIFSGLPESIFI